MVSVLWDASDKGCAVSTSAPRVASQCNLQRDDDEDSPAARPPAEAVVSRRPRFSARYCRRCHGSRASRRARKPRRRARGRQRWDEQAPMVAASALLMVLCAAVAAAVAATVDGVLVMGRDGRWHSDEPVYVGQQTWLLLLGSDLDSERVSFTPRDAERGSSCGHASALQPSSTDKNGSTTVVLPWRGRWFLCLRNGENWVHQGPAVSLTATGDPDVAVVSGVRGGGETVSSSKHGFMVLPVGEEVPLLLLGSNFSDRTRVTLTTEKAARGVLCREQVLIDTWELRPLHGGLAARVTLKLPHAGEYQLCVSLSGRWVHQGSDPLVTLEGETALVPVWVNLLLIGTLLVWSGLFSGLTLGLMALDKTELKVIESCGTPEERDYARKILPLRRRGNYLLCTLVLGNVCVNSSFTILLDGMLSSGPVAVLLSTLGIVLLGEIIPQAICSRYGLAIGARTILITKLFMIITFPLSWPISKLLDCVLGEEIGNVFDREKLTEYLRITKDYAQLENEELNIIFGALELTKKTAADIMTRIEDVYMLPYDAVLDFETMSEIVKRGYTRIPVYEGTKQNIVSLLNTKDLTFVDPDDAIPLATVCSFYKHPLSFVFQDETLDSLLREFKKGHSHMAFVRQVVQIENRDPSYNVTGLVTLEDVIEEIIQSEIIDETDVLTDNRRKQRRKDAQLLQDFSDFLKIGSGQQGKNVVSAQLAFATFQFLSTAVRAFTAEYVTPAVLRRLMAQNLFFTIKPSSGKNIFDAGKPCDFFTVVLEGRVRVTVGRESLVFEAGPFSYFGLPALTVEKGAFVPDYTVAPLSYVVYMKVSHSVYVAALRASRLGKTDDPNDVAMQESNIPTEDHKQTTANSTDVKPTTPAVAWSEPANA
ncbi:unextended protein-like isoform X1 [Dermacentor andersoni]|uniref:unextended protein-like isoform X1 n=1 Tax=Dermacentor andersoni TaxID=34620 RepID=UPI002155A6E9|nr:unextended protein-like isoform X1 [Dermacentor andersoni]